MNLKNLLEGIEIIRPYYDNPDGYNMGAEHDQFFMYATDCAISPEDVTKLHALGWFQQSVERGEYDLDEGWIAFV